MGEILLIRHGQASFGADNYDQLSMIGWEQARILGKYFRERELRFDQLISGAMVRHRQTLEGIVGTQVESEALPGLNEYDFQLLMNIYIQQFPAEPPLDMKDPQIFFRLLGKVLAAWAEGSLQSGLSESWLEFESRIKACLKLLLARHDAQRVLVISSGGVISMLVREVLGLTVKQMISMNLQMANTGITRLVSKGNKVRLQSWNGIPHLDHPLTQYMVTFA